MGVITIKLNEFIEAIGGCPKSELTNKMEIQVMLFEEGDSKIFPINVRNIVTDIQEASIYIQVKDPSLKYVAGCIIEEDGEYLVELEDNEFEFSPNVDNATIWKSPSDAMTFVTNNSLLRDMKSLDIIFVNKKIEIIR